MHTVSRCSLARATTASSARPSPSRSSAPASCTCSASPVSTTSEDVRPWWNQRPCDPSVSATASTNAAVSWWSVASSSATRSGVGGCARSAIARTASPGTAPSSPQASSAASSTANQQASFLSSDQTSAIAGREYREITGSILVAAPARSARLPQDSDCQDRRVLRAVDPDRGNRHARRELHDRKQRVEPVEDALLRAKRHADHG